jgi:hypothetical protein
MCFYLQNMLIQTLGSKLYDVKEHIVWQSQQVWDHWLLRKTLGIILQSMWRLFMWFTSCPMIQTC